MTEIRFVVDDPAAVLAFVAGLPPRLRRLRFADGALTDGPARWRPDHTVLATRDGVPVALADCIIATNRRIGAGALVATDDAGGYAVAAWRHMRKLFPVEHMQATMARPTDRLVALFRLLADSVYDQTAWQMAQSIWTSRANPQNAPTPTPIAITRANLKRYGIAPPAQWNEASRRQIAAALAITFTSVVNDSITTSPL